MGQDFRRVDPAGDRKSVSAETTFDQDLSSQDALEPVLWKLSERVSARLKASATAGSIVTLKLKTTEFQIRTRARALHEPTRLASRIFEAGRDLLAKETDGTRFRLIGIGVSDLTGIADADHGDLVDDKVRRLLAAEDAIDRVREKFGRDALKRGIVFRRR
jgi:DNA polymerase-4